MRTSLEVVTYTWLCAVGSLTLTLAKLAATGIETVSHIRENGRITVMFCAFEGPPRIVRLFGTGMCLDLPGDVPENQPFCWY